MADDAELDEALPPDLLRALRAPIEADAERMEEQIATALTHFEGDVSSLDRLRRRQRRWLPAAAAIVAAIVLGAGVVSRLGDSVTETTDRAQRSTTLERSSGDGLEYGVSTEAEEAPPRAGAPPSQIEGTGSAAAVDASPNPPGDMSVESSAGSATVCPGDSWWDTIRALLGRCR